MKSRRTVTFPGAAGFWNTLAPLRRGPRDPCFQLDGDGTIWRTSLLPSGPVTAKISAATPDTAHCEAWGGGAEEFVEMVPELLGADDDASGFVPRHPTVAAAHQRLPHLRLGRTGQILEALIPAVIEQRVPGADAFRSWRVLVSKYGTSAPGPAPAAMRVPPAAQVWRHIPSWEFHRANVDPSRAQTVVACARRAASLERLVGITQDWSCLDEYLLSYVVDPSQKATVFASSFAAALELVREGEMELHQKEAFAPLFFRKRPPQPASDAMTAPDLPAE